MNRITTEDYYCDICDKSLQEDESVVCDTCLIVKNKLQGMVNTHSESAEKLRAQSRKILLELMEFVSMTGMLSEKHSEKLRKEYLEKINKA